MRKEEGTCHLEIKFTENSNHTATFLIPTPVIVGIYLPASCRHSTRGWLWRPPSTGSDVPHPLTRAPNLPGQPWEELLSCRNDSIPATYWINRTNPGKKKKNLEEQKRTWFLFEHSEKRFKSNSDLNRNREQDLASGKWQIGIPRLWLIKDEGKVKKPPDRTTHKICMR